MSAVWVPGVAGAASASQWAVVDSAGTLVRGHGATTSVRSGAGTYTVRFSSDVTGCAYEASSGSPGTGSVVGPIEVTVASSFADANAVFVQTFDQTTGAVADEPFHIATYCGAGATFAVIDTDGTTARGSHVVSSGHFGPGYKVTFDHDVSKCAFNATIGTTGSGAIVNPGEIVVGGMPSKNSVLVHTSTRTGTTSDFSFHLAVTCGAKKVLGVVNGDGSTARGAHVTSSTHLNTGQYEVVFDRKVSACAYTATIGETGHRFSIFAPVTISTASRGANPKGVFIEVHNISGATQDEPFHLTVAC